MAGKYTRKDFPIDRCAVCLFSTILLLLTALPPSLGRATAPYDLIETDFFSIAYDRRDRRLAEAISAEAQAIRPLVVNHIGQAPTGRTRIVLAPSLKAFQGARPGGPALPDWAGAAAYPAANLILLRSPRAVRGERQDYRQVLIHEYTHICLGQALPDRAIPTFLSEGIAMLLASQWQISSRIALTKAALLDRLLTLEQLTGPFPSDPEAAELAYAQSFLFLSFLVDRFGREALHGFIRDYARGVSLERGLKDMTGMHPVVLEDKWMAYLKMRASWIPLATSGATVWFVASLLFVAGYWRKRRKARATLRRWEEEEGEE